jgi:hypothetical protein
MTFDRDITSPFLRDPDEPEEARTGTSLVGGVVDTPSDAPPDAPRLAEQDLLHAEADEITAARDSDAAEHDLRPADVDPLGTRGEAEGPATDLPPDLPASDGQAPVLRSDVSGAREHDAEVGPGPRRRQARPRRSGSAGEAGPAPAVARQADTSGTEGAPSQAVDVEARADALDREAVLDHAPQMPQRSVVDESASLGPEPHDHGQASAGQGSATGAPSTTTAAGRIEAPQQSGSGLTEEPERAATASTAATPSATGSSGATASPVSHVPPVARSAPSATAPRIEQARPMARVEPAIPPASVDFGPAAPAPAHTVASAHGTVASAHGTVASRHGTSAAGQEVALAHDVDSAHVVAGHEDDPRDDHHEAVLGPIDWRAWTMSAVGLLAGLAVAVLFYLATIPG